MEVYKYLKTIYSTRRNVMFFLFLLFPVIFYGQTELISVSGDAYPGNEMTYTFNGYCENVEWEISGLNYSLTRPPGKKSLYISWNGTGGGTVTAYVSECSYSYQASYSIITDVRLCPPTGLEQVYGTCDKIYLKWDQFPGVTGYYLDVSTESNFRNFVPGYRNLNINNVAQYTIESGLISGTTYYVRIRAYDSQGSSPSSNTVSCSTVSIADPLATMGSGATTSRITANWSDISGAETYYLDVSTNSSFSSYVGEYENLDVGNVLSKTITGLIPGQTYYYRVQYSKGNCISGNSNTIIYSTVPAAPVSQPATDITLNQMTANWDAAIGATGYYLDVSTNSSFTSYVSGYRNVDVGNVLQKRVTGLSDCTTYYYRVRAYNSSGTSNNSSVIEETIHVSPVIEQQPTDQYGRVGNSATFIVDVSGSNLTYQWRKNGANISGATSASYTITNIRPSDVAWYDVVITDGLGEKLFSSSAQLYVTFQAQPDKNYIISRTIEKSGVRDESEVDFIPIDSIEEEISYFDGLGRPMQTISVAASPSGADIVQPIVYDGFGREKYQLLPYISGESSGAFQENPDMTDPTSTYAGSEHHIFYQNQNISGEDKPYGYSETVFDNSPLNRVMAQGAPGQDWQPDAHPVRYSYETNEVQEVLLFQVVSDKLENTGGDCYGNYCYYEPNQLYKTVTKDENWQATDGKLHTTEEFKDKLGQVVLKRSYVLNSEGNVQPVETYYVYDDFGLLRYVIPPKATANFKGDVKDYTSQSAVKWVTSDEVVSIKDPAVDGYLVDGQGSVTLKPGFSFAATADESFSIITANLSGDLMYSYKYDGRKRMIEKKIPGAEVVYMVYDNRDRLVLTQDGEMREKEEWLFTKYDALNRPVMTGILTTSKTHDQLQTYFKNFEGEDVQLYETLPDNGSGLYTLNNSYPNVEDLNDLTEDNLQTITYYDDYDWMGSIDISDYYNKLKAQFNTHDFSNVSVPTIERFDKVKGQITGTKTRVLDDEGTWLESVTFYDDRYRSILEKADNYVGGEDIFLNKYDFVGKVMETWQCHTTNKTTPGKRIVRQVNTYDHAGRLLTTGQQMTGAPTLVTIVENTYNELGELKNKKVGKVGNKVAQEMDYQYNIRGWMTQINNPDETTSESRKFAMRLHYNDATDIPGAPAAQFNGNISGMEWRTPEFEDLSGQKRSYGFEYDGLNRLTSAAYAQANTRNTDYDVSIPEYDLNGNIRQLKRRQKDEGEIDALTYEYTGNQLMAVSDAATGTRNLGFEDGNTLGNDYSYDLNGNMREDRNKGLDEVIYNYLNLPQRLVGDEKTIDYIYDANGQKLVKKYNSGSQDKSTYYAGNFVYEDNQLQYILHGEGKVEMSGGTPVYQFNLKDHLGNVRAMTDLSGNLQQVSNYYPFGMLAENAQVGGANNKYRYNGKELQDDAIGNGQLDWYDYGARFYDAALARFNTVDPFAEDYVNNSPYNYVLNNPLIFIDPNGEKVKIIIYEKEAHLSTAPFADASDTPNRKNPNKDFGAAISHWSGSGKDDYGNFIVKSAINFGAHGENGEEVYGADLGVSASYIVDNKSKSIDDFVDGEPYTSIAVGPLEIIKGDGKFGLGVGLSFGGGSSKTNTVAAEFLAFTDDDIEGMAGIVTGYSINDDGYLVFDVQCGDVNMSQVTDIQPVEQEPGRYYTPSYTESKQNKDNEEN